MAIEAKASPTEQNSPFFLAHQRMVREWEAFAHRSDGILSGCFNSWYIELKLTTKRFEIAASRQLTTVAVGVPLDGRYQESFILIMRSAQDLQAVLVERKTFLNLFKRIAPGTASLAMDHRYLIKPKKDLDPAGRYLVDQLIQYDLRKLQIGSRAVFAELGVFPQNSAQLQHILDTLQKK